MEWLQKCNNITKNGTNNKKCNSRGVRKVHYFHFSTNPCILYIVQRFVLFFFTQHLITRILSRVLLYCTMIRLRNCLKSLCSKRQAISRTWIS